MVGGIERLIAAAFPLYYYRKKNSILRKLILLEYIISLSPLITAINITFQQPDRHVHDICLKHEIFQRGVYVIILLTRSLSAAASLIIMAAVVIIMKRYTQKLTERRNVQRNMEIFIEKQKQYTSTSVISCIITFSDVRTAVFDTFKKICKRNNTEMNMIKGTSVHLYCVRRQAQLRVPAKGLNRNITTE
ncbi:unnamed protein product [Thelazia callipaeda]|uniref:G_PROTEIN_RECEP_F1_2 domain-containing protein n=1 Tax=Thelazia callipaeda TaxID=103827 RepID=A0A0N5D1U0_THECL|nr:unnamed protein product [Thelazia callipaeda]